MDIMDIIIDGRTAVGFMPMVMVVLTILLHQECLFLNNYYMDRLLQFTIMFPILIGGNLMWVLGIALITLAGGADIIVS